jgi:hypothetical protein
MQLGPTALRAGALALCTAGTLTLGMGSASASTPTPVPQTAAMSSSHAIYHSDRDFCDDWHHRGDRRCHGDRWNWDNHFHRWNHDRWDGHRWNHR